jgi:hypothetical protein
MANPHGTDDTVDTPIRVGIPIQACMPIHACIPIEAYTPNHGDIPNLGGPIRLVANRHRDVPSLLDGSNLLRVF